MTSGLPEGWTRSSIDEICVKISSGGTPSRRNLEYYTDGSIRWLKSQELKDTTIFESEEKITQEALNKSSAKLYPVNTILIAMYGSIRGRLGILMRESSINQAICALVADKNIVNYRYLYYALLVTRDDLINRAFGVYQQNLNQDLVKNHEIPLPPLSIQNRIVSILSSYDDLIDNNRRRIQRLEETARILYREWFVAFRFPGHENVEMVDSDVGEIPDGWVQSKLGEIAEENRRNINPKDVSHETPYVGLADIPRKSIALSQWGRAEDAGSSKLQFKTGEILFGKIRPYFHKVVVAPVDGICSGDTIVVASKSSEMFGLVLSVVNSDEFVAHATASSKGTKMPRADWNVLENYPITVPESGILNRFNSFISNSVNLIHKLTFMNRNLQQMRDLLLPRLVSGRINVSGLKIEIPADNHQTSKYSGQSTLDEWQDGGDEHGPS